MDPGPVRIERLDDHGRAGRTARMAPQTGPGDSEIQLGPPRMLLDAHVAGNNISATPDGRVVVLSAKEEGAYAWIRGTPERFVHLGPQPDVRYVAVSPNGHWAATVTHIGGPHGQIGVNVWDVETGRRVTVLSAPNMSRAQFSPDGRSLVLARDVCQVWSVGSWRLEHTFDPGGPFTFSPDGRLLALCVGDAVRLYEFASGRRIATLPPPTRASRVTSPSAATGRGWPSSVLNRIRSTYGTCGASARAWRRSGWTGTQHLCDSPFPTMVPRLPNPFASRSSVQQPPA